MPKGQTVPPSAADAEHAAPRPEPRLDVRDVVAAIGLVLVVVGVSQVFVPAAWIVLGLAALAVAWRT